MLRRLAPTALLAALAISGCSASTAPDDRPQAPDRTGQSLWHVIDRNGRTVTQLPDDDPVVTKVRKTAVLHSGVVDNRDHRTVGDSASKEYTFYDKGFADKLRKERYGEKLADLFTKNHLVTRQTSIAWYKSTFPADMRTAKVEMDTTIEFVAADPGYLEASKFALDTPYTQHRTLSLARSGDTWTIVAIQKGPLTPQEQAPLKPGS